MKSAKILLILGLILVAVPVLAAEIPPTIPHPGINGENGYVISVVNRDTHTLDLRAPYLHDTPYDVGTGWLNGDRIGYNCGYGFLGHLGVPFGRVTFRLIPQAQAYGQINDTYMEEPNGPQNTAGGPSRYYDGTPNTTGFQASSLECPAVTESYVATPGVDDRDKAVFWLDGQAREIRDYLFADSAPNVTFDFLDPITTPFTVTGTDSGASIVNNRQPVLVIDNGVPIAVVYYDGIGNGSVIAPEDEPTVDDCNAIISMSQGGQVYSGSQAQTSEESELEALTGEQWMALINGGPNTLPRWKSNTIWGGIVERNRCAPDNEIDRVLFIFDPRGSAAPFTNDLNVVIGILHNRYPNAEVDVSLLVGGKNAAGTHVVCTITQRGRTQTVTASNSHKNSIALMTMAEAGPDLDVLCNQYADGLGHLNNAGAASAQAQVAAFYNSGG